MSGAVASALAGTAGRVPGWYAAAACAGRAPLMDVTQVDLARELIVAFCEHCPVLDACRAEAEAISEASRKVTSVARSPQGVWGGQLWLRGKPITRGHR